MIGLKNSYEIAYNGTENECRFELYADTAAEMVGVTHYDGIKIQMGSEFTDISTGDKYLLNGSGAWILQPSDRAFSNVYTKLEIDSMITEIYGIIAYYHTTLISDTGEITFYALSGYIGAWTIYGNGQQTGTPTFCGVRTANVMPAGEKKTIISNGITFESDGKGGYTVKGYSTAYAMAVFQLSDTFIIPNSVGNGGNGTLNFWNTKADSVTFGFMFNDTVIDEWSMNVVNRQHNAYNKLSGKPCNAIRITVPASSSCDQKIQTEFTDNGEYPTEFEPYGYKIPISCAGQTNNVYLSAPLRKAIDGTDAVDTLENTGIVTRNVDENGDALVTSTTETVSVPDIPTVKGSNTLTVDTDLAPSLIEISGGITYE